MLQISIWRLFFMLFFIGGGQVAAHHVATVWAPSAACHLCQDCLQHGAQVAAAKDACSSCPLLVAAENACSSCVCQKRADSIDGKVFGQRINGLCGGVADNEIPVISGMRALFNPHISLRQVPLGWGITQFRLQKKLNDSHFSTPGCCHFSAAADVVQIARHDELHTIAPRA